MFANRFPAFNNSNTENNNNVEILVHNVSGKLMLGKYNTTEKKQIVNEGITLTYDTDDGPVTIDGNDENDPNNAKKLEINTISCQFNLKHTPTTATCTAAGKQGFYTCTICQRIYLNDNATGETTLENLPVAGPLGHDLTHVPAKAPTYEHEGNIEHYRCKRCGALFSDANETQELTANDVVLAKLVRTDTLPQTDDLPQTGDSSRLTVWLALLGACCAGIWCLNRRRG